ncbi:MAG TPA: type II secretion system protein GspM [Solirubrobacteraceae bacterium]|jgi:hypothetical protein|nr:type II secretion system protein GspM [Solirubrobacteraceae bacterium]
MTARDRLMLIASIAIVLLVGGYFVVVSPEREKATKLSSEVANARQQLESAQTAANEAASARSRYAQSYASLVSLGPAVPASGETPALVYALAAATKSQNVEFSSITSGDSGPGGGSSSGSSNASSSTKAASATFTQMPFSFVFDGSFEDLYRLLAKLEGFTTQTASGDLRVNGRLLTIDGIQLGGSASGSGGSGRSSAPAEGKSANKLNVTVTATAYTLPAGAVTASGASAAAPGASPAASSSGSSSPTSAAVIKAGP